MNWEQLRAKANSMESTIANFMTSRKEEGCENIFRSYARQLFSSYAVLGVEMFGLGGVLAYRKGIVHYLNIRCHDGRRQSS